MVSTVFKIFKFECFSFRRYLINSPVVKAEPLNFREDGVKDVLKNVLRPWYNSFRFCVEACLKYQIDGNAFEFNFERGIRTTTNVTDLWILSSVQTLIKFVRAEMAAYRLYTVVPILLKFIDQLTNWYIRFNRKRLKGSSGREDCYQAISTLHYVLMQQTILMAPFTPFFAEHLYQTLRLGLPESQRQLSVHFCAIPNCDDSLVNANVEASMIKLQNVVELARQARDRRTLPVKTPLSTLHIVHSNATVLAGLQVKKHRSPNVLLFVMFFNLCFCVLLVALYVVHQRRTQHASHQCHHC
jgi:isoleucyl-tRNA synthetase